MRASAWSRMFGAKTWRHIASTLPSFCGRSARRQHSQLWSWAMRAGAIVFLMSKKTMMVPTSVDPVPSRSHSLDAGAAWAMLALQAQINGLATHAMVGLDFDKAADVMHVPDGYMIEMAFVVGKAGPKELLPEALQAREVQSGRMPVSDFVHEAVFKA